MATEDDTGAGSMLITTITLHPRGDATKAQTLATLTITNDGTGTKERGNYDVLLTHPLAVDADDPAEGEVEAFMLGRVEGWGRVRPSWEIVAAAIASLRLPSFSEAVRMSNDMTPEQKADWLNQP